MNKLNKIMFMVNAILIASLFFLWIVPFTANYLADVDDSMSIGMKPYFKRQPVTLLVDRNFPVTNSFMLGVEGIPVVFQFRSNDGSYEAKICLGLDQEVAIRFTNLSDPAISHVSLVNDDMFFKDHGGNGTYEESFSLGIQRDKKPESGPGLENQD